LPKITLSQHALGPMGAEVDERFEWEVGKKKYRAFTRSCPIPDSIRAASKVRAGAPPPPVNDDGEGACVSQHRCRHAL
jgi:hypothetical protein